MQTLPAQLTFTSHDVFWVISINWRGADTTYCRPLIYLTNAKKNNVFKDNYIHDAVLSHATIINHCTATKLETMLVWLAVNVLDKWSVKIEVTDTPERNFILNYSFENVDESVKFKLMFG